MNYFEDRDNLVIEGLKDFNIKEILECGQCFRFTELEEMKYSIRALGREMTVQQEGDRLTLYGCTGQEYEAKWRHYFDMDRDYSAIKAKISCGDSIMTAAVGYAGGIRLLNQEPYECLLSFIISQNNNIPRIKGIIAAMSDKYGTDGNFPTLQQLSGVTEEELFALKMGFRNKYIYDGVHRLLSGEVALDKLYAMPCDEAREELKKIKGVGNKVADCVLLFSLGHREVFPVDVWVRRVVSELYFDGEEQSLNTIGDFARDKWGELAGYAQQYLFYYARSGNMGR